MAKETDELQEMNGHLVQLVELERMLFSKDRSYDCAEDDGQLHFATPDHQAIIDILEKCAFVREKLQKEDEVLSQKHIISGAFQTVHTKLELGWRIDPKAFDELRTKWPEDLGKRRIDVRTRALDHYERLQRLHFTGKLSATQSRALEHILQLSSAGGRMEIKFNEADYPVLKEVLSMGVMKCASGDEYTLTGKQPWEWVLYGDAPAFEEVRTKVRAELLNQSAHDANRVLRERLLTLWPDEIASIPSALDDVNQVKPRLKEFFTKYGCALGCHPFFAGLRTVLRLQRASRKCYRWGLDNAVFTQCGDQFTQDAVDVLHALAFTPYTPIQEWNFDSHAGQDSNCFVVCEYLSNQDLDDLLGLLPREEDASPAGTMAVCEHIWRGRRPLQKSPGNRCCCTIC